jgi:hypothetical protein
MLLDNVLMAHGRQPFKGERKVETSNDEEKYHFTGCF